MINIKKSIEEFHNALELPAAQAVDTINNMRANGVLFTLIPEFKKFINTAEINGFKYKNILDHTMKVFERACHKTDSVEVRLAALLHDIGKSVTRQFIPGKGWNFHGHDKAGIPLAHKTILNLRYPKEVADTVSILVGLHMRPMKLFEESITDSAIRRLITVSGGLLPELMILCNCDFTTNNEDKIDEITSHYEVIIDRIVKLMDYDEIRLFKIPLNGYHIMETLNLEAGPYISEIKDAFKQKVINEGYPNTLEAGLEFTKQYARDHGII